MTETPQRPLGSAAPEQVRTPLKIYQFFAWATGLWLIALCFWMVRKYGFGDNSLHWVGIVHGWVYFGYLLATFNLALKVRWPVYKTIGVLIAGTIPLLGIIVEQYQSADVKTRFGL